MRNLASSIYRLITTMAVCCVGSAYAQTAASTSAPAATLPSVQGCTIQVAPNSAAAYFSISNPDTKPVTLTGVATPAYGMAMMHQTQNHDGMMHMSHLQTLEVPAQGQVVFAPGGYHVMLMDQKSSAPSSVDLTLSFKASDGHAFNVTVACPVKTPDAK